MSTGRSTTRALSVADESTHTVSAGLAGASLESWLRYWRASLADADLPSPVLSPNGFLEVELDALENGHLSESLTERLFVRAGRPRSRAVDDEAIDEDDDPPIPLRIALFRLRRVVRHGKAIELDRRHHAPLWVAARLLRSGRLLVPEGRTAWLARRYLEPVTAVGPVVGSLAAMDEFLTRIEGPTEPGWDGAWAFAHSLFTAVAREPPESFEPEGFRRFGPVIDVRSHTTGAVDRLVELCDRLVDPPSGVEPVGGRTPLLETLAISEADLAEAELADSDRTDLDATVGSRRHLGQMTGLFALGPAQRRALHAALRLEPGELLAVNGPPGTGKTTLVQSLLASAWVGRALRDEEPPLVVVCSTNNRAITNVLDSFASTADAHDETEDAARFGGRWLPDLPSYGLYMPARSRRRSDEEPYAVAVPRGSDWSGFPQRVESSAYVVRGRKAYLERAGAAFDSRFDDPRHVVDRLRAEMASTVDRLRAILERAAVPRDPADAHRSIEQLEAERSRVAESLAALDTDLDEVATLRDAVDDALGSRPWWTDVLSFVPAVRARRADDLAAVFDRHPVVRRLGAEPPTLDGRSDQTVARAAVRALDAALTERRADLERTRDEIGRRLEAERRRLDEVRELVTTLPDPPAVRETLLAEAMSSLAALEALLDRTLRRRLFFLAGRYWEGRWLLAVDRMLARPKTRTSQARRAVVARFRRWSMLTPVLVATLYRMPRIFDYYDGRWQPLLDTIDLLIVDEAGQVAPEVGAPVFALARRAVVVGDVHQLEPIWNVGQGIDHANLRAERIDPEALEEIFEGTGVKASEGSLMEVARRVTRFGDAPRHRSFDASLDRTVGVWLREHRRSVPPIVRFCNNLVYDGMLEPRRPELDRDRHPLPALAYGHVGSPSTREGASRRNQGQAEALAEWLTERREALESFYGQPLEDVVGVITPFAAQIQALIAALERHELAASRSEGGAGVAVGTVHTFQGGERPVVLFSPALAGDDSTWFLDRVPNLLNVAVSRARDSFVVLGDMSVFDPDPNSDLPTSVLARQLFESTEQELVDVVAAPELRLHHDPVSITTHRAHRELLRRAFETAGRRLGIFAPYLSWNAIVADDVPGRIAAARRRGVDVVVGHSPELSKWPTEESEAALRQAGATVVRLSRFHAKILVADERLYVSGSYNWLSAARDPESPHHCVERSLAVEGPHAKSTIQTFWRDLQTIAKSRS